MHLGQGAVTGTGAMRHGGSTCNSGGNMTAAEATSNASACNGMPSTVRPSLKADLRKRTHWLAQARAQAQAPCAAAAAAAAATAPALAPRAEK